MGVEKVTEQAAKRTFGEVIGELGGNFKKALVPEPGEVASRIARSTLSSHGMDEAGNIINKDLYDNMLIRTKDKLLKKGSTESAEDFINNKINSAKNLIQTGKEKREANYIEDLAKKYKNTVTNNGELDQEIAYGLKAAGAYMTEPGKAAYRWGAYGAASLGVRVLSGGTPFHNNTGETDIAGIPFI